MTLLGAFPKLRKATISFVMTVRPSIRMAQLGSHWEDFIMKLDMGRFFEKKNVEKTQV
jgi:hypothetical protein